MVRTLCDTTDICLLCFGVDQRFRVGICDVAEDNASLAAVSEVALGLLDGHSITTLGRGVAGNDTNLAFLDC